MSTESLSSARESTRTGFGAIEVAWHWPALGAILVLNALLSFISLGSVGLGNIYYAAAVKSMLTSSHNFFFVSLDPGGFVSIDKPPVAFWIQALSAKIFGFSGMSLLLPEAVAGVLSVALLYALVARVFGRPAGLLAALALAVTPVVTVVDRSNLVESILVLAVLLAVWAVIRATEGGRLSWLLLGMALVGVGFNVKMLEAYLVLPALLLTYFLGAKTRFVTRIWHLVVAVVVLLVFSLSWVVAVDATPVSQRPYVGSSGDNSELSLALGYNGLGRLTGNTFSFLRGGASLSNTLSDLSPTSLGFTQGETGAPGVQRLINAELGGQTGWLLVLAAIGGLAAAWRRRPRFPLDGEHTALVLWGTWLVTGVAFFSVAGFFHAYYLAMIAPPVAALAGIGIAALWADYRRPGWRGWILPPALVVAAAVQAHILSFFPDWSRWLTPLVMGISVVAAILLTILRLRLRSPRLGIVALAAAGLGFAALLLSPFIWSEYTVAHASANMVPSAGPPGGGNGGRFFAGFRGPGAPSGSGNPPPSRLGFGPPPGVQGSAPPPGQVGGRDDTAANASLVRYLENNQGRTRFLVATLNAGSAEPLILSTGKAVMDLGGFSGGDRIVDPHGLAALVSRGTIRYFLLSSGEGRGRRTLTSRMRAYLDEHGGFRNGIGRRFGSRPFRGGFGAGGGANADLVTWVTRTCKLVPPRAYGMVSTSAQGGFGGAQQLYDCSGYRAARYGRAARGA